MKDFLFTFDEISQILSAEWINPNKKGGVKSIFTDTRVQSPHSLFIALSGENFDAHDYLDKALEQGAATLCVEKSKLDKLPENAMAIAVDSTVEVYQHLANFHRRRFPALKVIALTGSSGKTGTKETLRAIFNHVYGADYVLATEGNTNNQIGVPQNLMRLTGRHKIAIIEMGTNHHGEIEPLSKTAEPDAALIVSIGNCHLEFLGSLEGVAKEKSQIFKYMNPAGTAVIPDSSPAHDVLLKAAEPFKTLTFGFGGAAAFRVNYLGGNINGSSFEIIEKATGKTVPVEWTLSGKHHASNAAGAAAVASSFGIPLEEIAEGIAGTSLPGMRMRRSVHHGATWINDAYNANPDSMKASLEWLSEFADPARIVLVLGDMGEIGADSLNAHQKLLEFAREKFPKSRILAVGKRMTQAFEKLNSQIAKGIVTFPDSAAAGTKILEHISAGDTVFLKASRSTKLELAEPAHGNE